MKTMLRLVAWLGRKAQGRLNVIEDREALERALKPGTLVVLSKCKCKSDHCGIWRIEHYNLDANDYKVVREGDGAKDYAKLDSMEIVSTT